MGHERVCSASKPTRQTPMDPTSPLWNPYPNKGELIKQNKKLSQASLSCIAMSHSIFLCVGRHYPPAQWVSHYKNRYCNLPSISACYIVCLLVHEDMSIIFLFFYNASSFVFFCLSLVGST